MMDAHRVDSFCRWLSRRRMVREGYFSMLPKVIEGAVEGDHITITLKDGRQVSCAKQERAFPEGREWVVREQRRIHGKMEKMFGVQYDGSSTNH
mgnify:CR=1 FL=1